MTNKDMEKRFSDIEGILLKLMEEKPSMIQKLWDQFKPYIIPFILGMMVGTIGQPLSFVYRPQATTEQQAALGGAVIPFQNSSPSPSPLVLPPKDSTAEWSGSSLTNIFEPPLPANRQADNGQTTSTKLFRRLVRLTP
jgi:hypothetical protein